MIRTRIINYLIENRGYKSYLEIGLSWPDFNYAKIKCENKESCDPYFPSERDAKVDRNNLPEEITKYLTYLMTSDEMFEQMPDDKKYDIIFIDGLHVEEQVTKDIVNSMKHLNPGGVILVHDAIPLNEEYQKEDTSQTLWVGTVWKAVAKLNNTNLTFHTVKEDVGLSIIEYNENPDFSKFLDKSDFDFKRDFSYELMHVISDREFREMYGKKNYKGLDEAPVTLVAHFNITDDASGITENDKLHFKCIEYYKNLFSSVQFVLAIDKNTPFETIDAYKKQIFSLGFNGDVSVKLQEKTKFGESHTFYYEIVKKLSTFDGIVAFVYNKSCDGDGNDSNKLSLKHEVISSYFQLFDDFEYVKRRLYYTEPTMAVGAFQFNNENVTSTYKWNYINGFQCLNAKRTFDFFIKSNYVLPELDDKNYAANFFGDICLFNTVYVGSAYNIYITSDPSIMYENSLSVSYLIFGDEKYNYDYFTEDISEYEL